MTGEGLEPAVFTIGATLIELYSATLMGDLTDMGGAASVDVSFEWDIASGEPYGNETTPVNKNTIGTFSVALTDLLTHNTTYYFRAKAEIGGGLIRYGDELSFTTLIEQIGISVDPTSIDFGSMPIGQPSATETVTVSNTGDVSVDLDASLANISDPDVYTTGLTIDNLLVSEWGVIPTVTVAIGADTGALPLVLTVPVATPVGTYTATLVFWAEASP